MTILFQRFTRVSPVAALLCLLLFAFSGMTVFGADEFPETFPEAWKTKKMRAQESRKIADGIHFYHYHFDDFWGNGASPLSVYYLFIEWDQASVTLALGQVADQLKTVETMAREKGAIAAVNGAYFFFKEVAPYFHLRIDGTTYLPPKGKGETYCDGLVFSTGEFPQIVRFQGDKKQQFESYQNVIQGYRLGSGGVSNYAKRDLSKDKHDTPYTVIGTIPEKRILILFVADGRHKNDSVGLAFQEIPDFLTAVGAKEVLSIDGGGSSTMVIPQEKGELGVVNHPSDNKKFDHAGARKVQSCILVLPYDKKK